MLRRLTGSSTIGGSPIQAEAAGPATPATVQATSLPVARDA